MIVQRDGDMSIMGGRFQQKYLHEVPPVSKWQGLLEEYRSELLEWEIEAVQKEVDIF